MAVTETALVLRFDFTRVRWGQFNGWGEIDHYQVSENDLYYHGGKSPSGSFANGAKLIRSKISVNDLVQAWIDEEDPTKREYAKFKIYDRKNDVNVETSCGSEFRSNYFQQSNLPWDISPAFFRPEVLLRFKANPEKFSLEDRSITCRGTWHLKSYDINEAGQVHVYLCDLANLPYEEQLYWQSFNEWPKDHISKRAYQTDIQGEWDTSYDPLESLKSTIIHLDKSPPNWWKSRGEPLLDVTRYPATDSPKEWGDELLALDQLLVEGFLLKPLRLEAESLGREIDAKWQPLRVMQEVLIGKGYDEQDAKKVMAPFQRLHALRTEVKGHATTDKKQQAELKARSEFGNFRSHFTALVTDCEKSLLEILKAYSI